MPNSNNPNLVKCDSINFGISNFIIMIYSERSWKTRRSIDKIDFKNSTGTKQNVKYFHRDVIPQFFN